MVHELVTPHTRKSQILVPHNLRGEILFLAFGGSIPRALCVPLRVNPAEMSQGEGIMPCLGVLGLNLASFATLKFG